MSAKSNRNQIITIIVIFVAILCCICAAGGWLIYSNYQNQAALPATSQPQPTQATDNSWKRIQAAGKMVVATSGDYPPFAYYNAQYRLDGFDVALVVEIGKRLNIPIDLKDMAFDGLGNAIQLGQIDLAAAAISITPQRQAAFDFSNVYYTSSTAVLANQNSTIPTITNVDQMASYRIGVQKDTVFQNWIQESLVDTGKMPASNLYIYPQLDSAINDLKANRIDVVVLDLPTANSFVTAGGVKLVGQNLNPQLYGMAMAKGATALQSQVNKALTQMQNDGTLAALTQQFFGQTGAGVQPQPTPIPNQPTPTPAPCIDGMAFVQDLNYPDKNMTNPPKFYPGEEFQKGWRIKNTGTCPWDITYSLVYVDGNTPAARMGGQPTAVNAKVQPGAMYDMYVNLVAPLQPGVYQGFWQLRNPQGLYFGDRIWVGIQVRVNDLTPTVVPQPVIQRFSADPPQINAGGCVNVQWEVVGDISNVKILRNTTSIWGDAPFTGSMTDCPSGTGQVIYQIEAAGPGGTSLASRPVNVVGAQPTAVPPTQPPAQPTATQPPPPTATQPPPPTATQPPPPTATQPPPPTATPPPPTPELPASTPTSEPIPPTAAPQPTPVPAPPLINSFVVKPSEIKVGECVNGSWSVSGDVQVVRILRNDKIIVDNAPMAGNGQDCFQNSGTEVYTLEAVGSDGKSVTQQQTVTVNTADTSLVLVSYLDDQGQQAPVLPGTQITAVLGANNSLTGSAGCNTYSTTYQINGANLTIAPPSAGKKVCPDPQGIMEQEQSYLAALTKVNGFQVAGDTLKLTMKYIDPADNTEKVSVLLVFQKAK